MLGANLGLFLYGKVSVMENEWDVHIVEILFILKFHYCLHDLMFQTTFLQSSRELKLSNSLPFIIKTNQGHFERLKQVFSKYKR